MFGYSQNMRSNFDFFPSLWLPWTVFFFVAAGISIQNLEDLDQVNGIQSKLVSRTSFRGSGGKFKCLVPLPHLVAAQCRGPADQKQLTRHFHPLIVLLLACGWNSNRTNLHDGGNRCVQISCGSDIWAIACYLSKMVPPSDVCWFRFAPVTIVISTINHSYWSYVHQLSYPTGASHCLHLYSLKFNPNAHS